MMGVLRWRHDLRSDAGQQQQQRPNSERSSTGHNNHAHAHTHTLPKLISQVSFSRAHGNSLRSLDYFIGRFVISREFCLSIELRFDRTDRN